MIRDLEVRSRAQPGRSDAPGSPVRGLLAFVVAIVLCLGSFQSAWSLCLDGAGRAEVEADACSCDVECGPCMDVPLAPLALRVPALRDQDAACVGSTPSTVPAVPGSPDPLAACVWRPYLWTVESSPLGPAHRSVVLLI